jgi:hypothetical protein
MKTYCSTKTSRTTGHLGISIADKSWSKQTSVQPDKAIAFREMFVFVSFGQTVRHVREDSWKRYKILKYKEQYFWGGLPWYE